MSDNKMSDNKIEIKVMQYLCVEYPEIRRHFKVVKWKRNI